MTKIMELPKLGVNMEKAKIVEWIVQVGDRVELDQELLLAETDKAVVEIPATVSGILAVQVVQVHNTVECGEPIAVFIEPGEELPVDFSLDSVASAVAEPSPAPIDARAATEIKTTGPTAVAPSAHRERVKISPRARRTAKEMDIDIRNVQPAKAGARITHADVLTFAKTYNRSTGSVISAKNPGQLPLDDNLTVKKTVQLDGIRGTIAQRLWQSTQASAPAVLLMKVDMTAIQGWRRDLKAQGQGVSYNSLMVAVVAKALSEFSEFNARMVGTEIQIINEINIGIAVDTPRGLLVPVVRNADRHGVVSIDADFNEKAERAKAGKATIEDLSGGTFTITNLGMFGVEAFIPIINPPEAAILAIGNVNREQVFHDDDSFTVKPILRMSLVWDHRFNDGAPAARFLARIKQIMELPIVMLS